MACFEEKRKKNDGGCVVRSARWKESFSGVIFSCNLRNACPRRGFRPDLTLHLWKSRISKLTSINRNRILDSSRRLRVSDDLPRIRVVIARSERWFRGKRAEFRMIEWSREWSRGDLGADGGTKSENGDASNWLVFQSAFQRLRGNFRDLQWIRKESRRPGRSDRFTAAESPFELYIFQQFSECSRVSERSNCADR